MLIIGIIFISANLRAPLTSVGPFVSLIRDSLHISNTLAGMADHGIYGIAIADILYNDRMGS